LAGSDDGSVRLHSVANEKPLITWSVNIDISNCRKMRELFKKPPFSI
jgi:hypothetical protein